MALDTDGHGDAVTGIDHAGVLTGAHEDPVPSVGRRRRWIREDLYEQCSLHITAYRASSRWLGARPRILPTASNSSSVRPSARCKGSPARGLVGRQRLGRRSHGALHDRGPWPELGSGGGSLLRGIGSVRPVAAPRPDRARTRGCPVRSRRCTPGAASHCLMAASGDAAPATEGGPVIMKAGWRERPRSHPACGASRPGVSTPTTVAITTLRRVPGFTLQVESVKWSVPVGTMWAHRPLEFGDSPPWNSEFVTLSLRNRGQPNKERKTP